MAGGWALLAISPIALAPNGPSTDGFSRITLSNSGRSSSDGREVGAELLAAVLHRRVVRIRALQQAEPEAHHRAALDLPLDERRVDGPADVVDLEHLQHRRLARLVVDLDVDDARRVGDRRVRLDGDRAVVVVDLGQRLERRAVAGDELAVDVGRRAGHVGDRDLAVRRALGQDLAVDDLEVVGGDLELLGGDVEDPLARLLGRVADRVAADEGAARGEGARCTRPRSRCSSCPSSPSRRGRRGRRPRSGCGRSSSPGRCRPCRRRRRRARRA